MLKLRRAIVVDSEPAAGPEQCLVVERHLAFCDPCVDYLDQVRAVIRTTGELREDDVPEPLMEALVDAFRAMHGEHN